MAAHGGRQRTKAISRNSKLAWKERTTLRWLTFTVAIFSIGLYLNTLGNDYVLDDFSFIKGNYQTLQGFQGIPSLWSHHSRFGYWNNPGEVYRPIPMTMFAIEWALAPDQPWLGHLVNVLLFAITASTLLLLLARWMQYQSFLFPLLTTLLFVAHPVHVEVVANIKSRDEILMLLLCLVSLWLLWEYLNTQKVRILFLALASYTAALFSKESAVTFVAIVPLTMYFFSRSNLRKIVMISGMYSASALLFLVIRTLIIGDIFNPREISVLDNFLVGAKDMWTFSASAVLMLGKYLWTLVIPHPLSSDFGYNQIPLTGWGNWRVLVSVAVWAGLGTVAFARCRSRDLYAFSILFFMITFSTSSNLLVRIGTSYGDRLVYSASLGFSMALALFLTRICAENERRRVPVPAALFGNSTLWVVAGIILTLYSFKTVTRNADWKDGYTLCEADIVTSPESAKLNFQSGVEVAQKALASEDPTVKESYFELAKQRLRKAIRIYPSYPDAYVELGLVHYRQGNNDEAMENYHLALKHNPDSPLPYNNMGIVFFEQGNLTKAKEAYEKALQRDPRMKDALRNLGVVHAIGGDYPEAVKWFSRALEYWPEDPTLNFYLGSAYRDSGLAEKGRPFLEKAIRLDPSLKK